MSILEIVLYSCMGLFLVIFTSLTIRKAIRKKKGLVKEEGEDD